MDFKISNNPFLVFHKNCTDGFGAYYEAEKVLRRNNILNTGYLPMTYGNVLDDIFRKADDIKGKDLYVMDFSFTPDEVNEILKVVNSITILDHHRTAADMWMPSDKDIGTITDDRLFIHFDMNKSGALLAWSFFNQGLGYNQEPAFVKYISDRDLWRFELGENTKKFFSYLSAQETSFDSWTKAESLLIQSPDYLLGIGEHLQKYFDGMVEGEYKSNKVRKISIPIPGVGLEKGLAINSYHRFSSSLGEKLFNTSKTYSIVWNTDGVTAFCSVRSVPEYDSSVISTYFGGGGHKCASGFRLPLTDFISFLV